MISRKAMQAAAEAYDPKALALACIASHSGLDVYDGAVDEGLRSIAVAQKGRDDVYRRYFKTLRDGNGRRVRGCVDDAWVYPKYDAVMAPKEQARLKAANALWVPNRAWTSYCGIDGVEDAFEVPVVGSRSMLRSEDRGVPKDYYWLLKQAGLPSPPKVKSPDDIDELVIVKLHHAQKKLERGFFTCASPKEFHAKSGRLLKDGVIDAESLAKARIEKYVIGPVFNLNFFHSPVSKKTRTAEPLELLGIDWRFESSLDGHVRIPAPQQMTLPAHQLVPEMTVVGHNTATVRESLLGKVFEMGEKWVAAAKEHYDPGIIGPFCLQTCVDKDMNFWIYDVAPRIGGGTNVHVATGHPYGNALWRTNMSTGRRVALEVKRAVEADCVKAIVT
ncbi:MAG: 5-formaminoimidazole-4-carboxamide-(beta)-D-ribofuranosyl 5-monophosphate synthetase [Thermoplasmata archaeon]|jgi:5-formaminoimidazole-4-carboxamide-1-(beta)-D-ribofuranosyl 5'-monophosphate synthetase|nr:5-formaminoimidazole-4-carboxamide-(beta)-D-ribofuranosyl 5-monophosphate synthetase [Thermoplasmata archaeon]